MYIHVEYDCRLTASATVAIGPMHIYMHMYMYMYMHACIPLFNTMETMRTHIFSQRGTMSGLDLN